MIIERLLTLSNKASGTVDTCGVELYEFKILQRQPSPDNHSIPITRTRVCTSATKVCSPISTSSQNSLMGPEAMERTVLHVQRNHADTLSVLHYEIQGEVFYEEICVVAERLPV
jgi:hypothetical protein